MYTLAIFPSIFAWRSMVTKMPPVACVVGLGFIGLPTAVLIANEEISVLGVDVKKEVVGRVNEGNLAFMEPG